MRVMHRTSHITSFVAALGRRPPRGIIITSRTGIFGSLTRLSLIGRSSFDGRPFSAFRRCCPVDEKFSVKVPTLGESITEGTIVEWTADIGKQISEGDVVALIETDKVTIDIKAEMDGVIAAHFGDVGDNVEVGSDLYEIDTEMVEQSHNVPASDSSADLSYSTKGANNELMELASKDDANVRKPSIRFLGKEGWALRLMGKEAQADLSAVTGAIATTQSFHALIPDDPWWDPMHGRPDFTDEEMDALLMGGASSAPKILKPSSGAVFA